MIFVVPNFSTALTEMTDGGKLPEITLGVTGN